MTRDPLQALLRARQTAVDDAQKVVAEAYHMEQEAIEAVRQATESLELEMREASSITAGDETVEAFARWLPVGRKRIAQAHARQRDATSTLDQVRTILVLARSGVCAVETVIQKKRDEKAIALGRREQAELDEFSARRTER